MRAFLSCTVVTVALLSASNALSQDRPTKNFFESYLVPESEFPHSLATQYIQLAADVTPSYGYTGPCGGSYSCANGRQLKCDIQHRPYEPSYASCYCERASVCNP
jgi:hypothetical protein